MRGCKRLNLKGQQFGKLTVLAPAENVGRHTAWRCRCECGNELDVMTYALRSGSKVSCGCWSKVGIDYTGQTIGDLHVLGRAPNVDGSSAWYCQCECGETFVSKGKDLTRYRSCHHYHYPETLYAAVMGGRLSEIRHWEKPEDWEPGFDAALSTLTEREQAVISKRFKEEMTLTDVAREYCVTVERIRQIEVKALRKLRNPSRSDYIRYGYQVGKQKADERESARRRYAGKDLDDEVLPQIIENAAARLAAGLELETNDIPVRHLRLSPRSANVLYRNGTTTLEQLVQLSQEDLMRVRNLGPASIAEVVTMLKEDWGFDMPVSHVEAKTLAESKALAAGTDAAWERYVDAHGTPIKEMRLSVRSANTLARGGIFYVEDLTKMTQADLLKVRGLGRGCAAEIVSVLKEDYGFIMPLGYAEARKPGRPKKYAQAQNSV